MKQVSVVTTHLPWLHRYLETRRRLGRQSKHLTLISSLVVHVFRLFKQSPRYHVELGGFKQGSVCIIGFQPPYPHVELQIVQSFESTHMWSSGCLLSFCCI